MKLKQSCMSCGWGRCCKAVLAVGLFGAASLCRLVIGMEVNQFISVLDQSCMSRKLWVGLLLLGSSCCQPFCCRQPMQVSCWQSCMSRLLWMGLLLQSSFCCHPLWCSQPTQECSRHKIEPVQFSSGPVLRACFATCLSCAATYQDLVCCTHVAETHCGSACKHVQHVP